MKNSFYIKILNFFLCVGILFFYGNVNNDVYAWTVNDAGNLIMNTGQLVSGVLDTGANVGSYASQIKSMVLDQIKATTVMASKILALLGVQKATQAIIGKGSGQVITDYNTYLYISPQQIAMEQMNAFFVGASGGRFSSLNYEGVGFNYDSYLVAKARQEISEQAFKTTMADYVSDPKQMLATGNMKAFTSFFECANNPYCYTTVAKSQYQYEFEKAQAIAKAEQVNGFMPTKNKKNGKIIQPAVLLQSALTQVDQMGTQLIMTADPKDPGITPFTQIAKGAVLNIASRSLNYYTTSDQGKTQIQNKNDQFPFSLAYNTNTGLNLSSGGITTSVGSSSSSTSTPKCTPGSEGDLSCKKYNSAYVCGSAGKCVKK